MRKILERFEGWLQAHTPAYLENLGPGISDAEITAATADFPFALNDSLRALYRWRNGDPEEHGILQAFRIFESLEGALGTKEMLDEMHQSGEWAEDGAQPPGIWSPTYLPIFRWDSGYHLCVDFGGVYGGHAGQVVEVWLKDEDRSIVAPDLTRWLDAHVASLEAGLWSYDDDGEQWEPNDHDAFTSLLAKHLPGYPIETDVDHPLDEPLPLS